MKKTGRGAEYLKINNEIFNSPVLFSLSLMTIIMNSFH
jgi:hypothetical protein